MAGNLYQDVNEDSVYHRANIFCRFFSCFCYEFASGKMEDYDEADETKVQQDESCQWD